MEIAADSISRDVKQTDYVKIDGIYVDTSYHAISADGNKKLVYVFFDAFTNAENLQVSSDASELIINDTNSYSSLVDLDPAIGGPVENYYYDYPVEDVYIGESQKVLLTFEIPAVELEPGRTITMKLYGIPDTDKIKMNTNDIVSCPSGEEIAQLADPTGYAAYLDKRQLADAETIEKVKHVINGAIFRGQNSSDIVDIIFEAPDKFHSELNGKPYHKGTYQVEKDFLELTIDAVDASGNQIIFDPKLIPWEWYGDEVVLTNMNAMLPDAYKVY